MRASSQALAINTLTGSKGEELLTMLELQAPATIWENATVLVEFFFGCMALGYVCLRYLNSEKR